MYAYNIDETITRNSQQTSAFSAVCQLLANFYSCPLLSPRSPTFNHFYGSSAIPNHHLCGCGGWAGRGPRAATTLSCFRKRLPLRKQCKDLCAVCIPVADSKVPTQEFHLPLVLLSTEDALSLKQLSPPGENLPTKHILLCFHLHRIKNTDPHANSARCVSIE